MSYFPGGNPEAFGASPCGGGGGGFMIVWCRQNDLAAHGVMAPRPCATSPELYAVIDVKMKSMVYLEFVGAS